MRPTMVAKSIFVRNAVDTCTSEHDSFSNTVWFHCRPIGIPAIYSGIMSCARVPMEWSHINIPRRTLIPYPRRTQIRIAIGTNRGSAHIWIDRLASPLVPCFSVSFCFLVVELLSNLLSRFPSFPLKGASASNAHHRSCCRKETGGKKNSKTGRIHLSSE